ncbi:sensor domain-containing diguanylate cyclase [Kineococcus indalonis]|uniref:sensor domain-containing diguanylate cyclase n=1 Tax=Kineococcus indalonis TaxID=2696566 RepID=UPI0014132EF7|nr:sensor domain-containing diguanylate cyclase [Kineococcus indalonis]NAZ86633.1 diguanylate cyclase [Kineococcus indalonis]
MRGPEESARLAALEEHRPAAGGDDRADLDAVVRLAAALTGAPVVTVSLIDAARQCHLSAVGPLSAETAVEESLCAVAFRSGDLVHVPDARLHPVHRHNPHVDGRLASMRLYASAPLVTTDGHALGTLCVFDTVARALDERQLAGLRDLAEVAVSLLQRRREARRAELLAVEADEQRALAQLVLDEVADAHRQLAAHAARVEALARASAAVATADDPRTAICEAVRDLCGADVAYLAQPGPDGVLTTTAAVGMQGVHLRLDPRRDTSLVLDAYLGREQLFEPDVPAHPRASRAVVEACGTASAVWQPVLRRGCEPVGVLAVVWQRPVAELPAGVSATLATLAGEAAHALERAELLERLERAAEHDALTGLPNRRRWDEVAAAEVARAARTGAPLTFALIDLDRFKKFNDTRGHLAGDELLREFAAAAGAQLREEDTLARWGGEEFVLALPGCDAAGAVAVADRVRAVVPRGQSCTVGVAQWAPGRSPAEVLAAADAALYRGKQAGRDATVTC